MEKLEKIKNIYKDIFEILKKYKDDVVFDIEKLEKEANIHIFGIKLKEIYGLNINPKEMKNIEYNYFGDFKSICLYGRTKKVISSLFKDDEYIVVLHFPTGRFIFSYDGVEYPKEFFQKFWDELKSFKPDYENIINSTLCWKLENAKDVFNSFESILEKYHKLNKKRIIEEKIKKLKMELDNLQKD